MTKNVNTIFSIVKGTFTISNLKKHWPLVLEYCVPHALADRTISRYINLKQNITNYTEPIRESEIY